VPSALGRHGLMISIAARSSSATHQIGFTQDCGCQADFDEFLHGRRPMQRFGGRLSDEQWLLRDRVVGNGRGTRVFAVSLVCAEGVGRSR
jgi:hypothetical protein